MEGRSDSWIDHVLNALLYGNFWIAACALAACWQTHLLLTHSLPVADPYPWFVACGTLALYSTHRLVGIRRNIPFADAGRQQVIYRYRRFILICGLGGLALAGWLFWQLRPLSRWALLAPVSISLLYVTPLFKGKRLRDLPLVKIFLIALAWGLLTVWVYGLERGLQAQLATWIMLVERMLFIFAITVPFDIRDLKADERAEVSTLPRILGITSAKELAYFSLGLAAILVALQAAMGWYPWAAASGLGVSFLAAAWLIRQAHAGRPDRYFSGWVDGSILLQFALVLAGMLGSGYL